MEGFSLAHLYCNPRMLSHERLRLRGHRLATAPATTQYANPQPVEGPCREHFEDGTICIRIDDRETVLRFTEHVPKNNVAIPLRSLREKHLT